MKYQNRRSLLIHILLFYNLSIAGIICPEVKHGTEADIVFLKPLRVNEINFYKIILHDPGLYNSRFTIKLYHSSFEKAFYSFDIYRENSIISKNASGVILEGYFFLPNVLPVGKALLEMRTQKSVVYKNEITIHPEIIFHSPMFQKGFPLYASESETGMRNLEAEAYPMAQISFSNHKKKSFFFFRVQLKESGRFAEKYEKVKLRIFIKQRLLDEIIVDRIPKEYVYCLAKDFVGSIEWLKIRFETYTLAGDKLIFKDAIYRFEYFSLLPFNGIPRWINHFLKDSDVIEKKFRCKQD